MPDRQTRISLPKPMLDRLVAAWLPRALHPGAWWLWALGLAVAATRTTNPILLLLIIAVASVVVMARRPDTPWARSFRIYLMLGLVVVVFRVVFRMLFGGFGPTVLFTLPSIQLPEIMAGVHLLGAVSAEALLGAFYDGLRLATMIICVGAANSLANPKRLLASVPPALYEIGTVLVVSVSVFPQLAESTIRVKRAGPSGPVSAAAGRRCAASSFRCWPTRWTDRCCSPRRWIPAATAAAPTCRGGSDC